MAIDLRRSAPAEELDEIEPLTRPLTDPAELDPLVDRIGDARYVLLGEASHGTSEYYEWRAALTRRLIAARSAPSSPSRATGRTASASTAG